MQKKLLFVYNADATLYGMATDFVHKIVSPKTYKCALCKLTYGKISIKKDWQQFIDTLPHQKEFLHKDELVKKYSSLASFDLPAIFIYNNNAWELLISSIEMKAVKSLDELQSLLLKKLV